MTRALQRHAGQRGSEWVFEGEMERVWGFKYLRFHSSVEHVNVETDIQTLFSSDSISHMVLTRKARACQSAEQKWPTEAEVMFKGTDVPWVLNSHGVSRRSVVRTKVSVRHLVFLHSIQLKKWPVSM